MAQRFDFRDEPRGGFLAYGRALREIRFCHHNLRKLCRRTMGNPTLGDLAKGIGHKTEAPPERGGQLCGDIDMRIARDGTWFYHGSPIGRKPLMKLFASVLKRDSAGDFWLETPAEKCRVRVDDAPFVAVEMSATGSGRKQVLEFRTNVDEIVTAGHHHPLRVEVDEKTGEPSPYIYVRDGLEALIARAVFYDLVALGAEDRDEGGRMRFGVWSDGAFFPLGEEGLAAE